MNSSKLAKADFLFPKTDLHRVYILSFHRPSRSELVIPSLRTFFAGFEPSH